MVPKGSAEVLSHAPESKMDIMSLMGKKSVLDRLHSGLSFSAVGCEFNESLIFVNESLIHVKLKCLKTEIHVEKGYVLIDEML